MANLTSTLDIKVIDDVTKPVKAIGEAMKKVESQISAIDNAFKNSGSSAGFQRQLASIGKSAGEIDSVANAWKKYASSIGAAESAGNWTKNQANQIKTWEQATIRSLRNVESQEKSFQRSRQQLADAHMRTAERAGERAGFGHTLRNGVLAYTGAHAVMHAGKYSIEQGAETAHELAAIQSAHQPTPEEMEEIKHTAQAGARAVPTSTYADNLKVINETIGAFGNVQHALEHLQFNQKVASVVHAAAGDKVGADAGEMGQAFARFGEMRGSAMHPEQFERENAGLAKAMIFTRGNFNPHEMLGLGAQAHAALQNYDEDFLTNTLPILAAERGGERTGTGASAFRNLILGKARDAKQAQQWMDLGLLDPKKVTLNNQGAVIGWTAGAVKDTDLALKNPKKWAEQVELPAMRGKGINVDDQMELTKVLGTMYRNQMANQFAEDMSQLNSRNRLDKDSALLDKTMGMDESYQHNLKNDPTQAIKTVSGAVTDLSQALTAPSLASAGPVLTSIASGVKQLAQELQDHPNIATAAGVTGGAAALGGSGYLASSMAGGLGMTAISGLATAVGALGTAAAVATGSVSGLYLLMQKFDPLGKEERTKRDAEILEREGRQPGGQYEHEIDPFKTGGWKPWVSNMFGGGAPIGTPGSGPQIPEYEPYGFQDMRAMAAPPGWSVNQPQKSFPMTGSSGATAGSEAPEYSGITPGLGDIQQQLQQAGNGAGEAGAKAAGDFGSGFLGQLEETVSRAGELIDQLRGMLDFSASPKISPTGDAGASAPRRTSSLGSYDHRRASGAEITELS